MTVRKGTAGYPLVYVEWQDAEHDGGWSDPLEEAEHRLGVIASIGWLIHENKQRIVVASSLGRGSLQVGNKQYIPTDQITKIKKMRQAR